MDICSKFCSGTGSQNKGVLISGGSPSSSVGKKVELYNLINKTTCNLPDLPVKRYDHISVGGVICGGDSTAERTSCVDIKSGSWSSSKYQSIRDRSFSVTWNINPGHSFMILGGYNSQTSSSDTTTDIVYTNGTVEPGFDLQYAS